MIKRVIFSSANSKVSALAFLVLSVTLLMTPAPRLCAQAPTNAASAADSQTQVDVDKALNGKRFANVKASVADGVVTLTGTVGIYSDKLDAENRVHHRRGVQSVANRILVAGPTIEDATLRSKLGEKLVNDRIGYGTITFDAYTLSVQNGVVTLGGVAVTPADKDSAIGLVENYPGVKDVVDHLQVAPPSPNDDRIRFAEARSVYGATQLNRYGLDPSKPIRIVVLNGNVTLVGIVDTEADKEVAGIRANGVPGVFKVTNDLQVARPDTAK